MSFSVRSVGRVQAATAGAVRGAYGIGGAESVHQVGAQATSTTNSGQVRTQFATVLSATSTSAFAPRAPFTRQVLDDFLAQARQNESHRMVMVERRDERQRDASALRYRVETALDGGAGPVGCAREPTVVTALPPRSPAGLLESPNAEVIDATAVQVLDG